MDLTGRNALIMGAPAELARALALRIAEAGADIALTTASSDAEEALELRRVSRLVSDLGRRCLVESIDMSIGTSVQVAVRQVAKGLGRIDILVVAPNFRLQRPAERLSDADWSRVLSLNLSGVFYACRGAAREMLNREPEAGQMRGHLVVISEQPGLEDSAAYWAAKAGLTGLITALENEWGPKGIGVDVLFGRPPPEAEDPKEMATAVLELVSGADQPSSRASSEGWGPGERPTRRRRGRSP